MNRYERVLLWSLYDFANSFASILLIFYFPLILVERGGVELWIGITSSISTALLLLMLPRIGHWVDVSGKARTVIFLGTISNAATLVAIACVFTFLPQTHTTTLIGLVLFGLFYIGFEASVSVYTALLRSVTEGHRMAAISGYAYALGQVGNVCGVLLASAAVASGFIFYGLTGKPLGLCIGGIAGIVLAIPFLWSLPTRNVGDATGLSFSYRTLIRTVVADKMLFVFLVGMALLYDTILTFQIYMTAYVKTVFDFTEQLTVYGGVLALSFGIVGAACSGLLSKLLGSPAKALVYSAALYMLCAYMVAFVPNQHLKVFALMALSGVSYGLVFSLGRAVFAHITPPDKQNTYFGIFTVFERMAAVVGPLIWTITFLTLTSYGTVVQYRGSVVGLALIATVGFFVLRHFERMERRVVV